MREKNLKEETRNRPLADRRHLLSIAAIAVVLLGLVNSPAALGSKGGDYFIGVVGAPATGSDADGGQFNGPRDVAVNQQTGQVFVVDQRSHRIQRLDADGNFELAWGGNVSESDASGDGGAVFETCSTAADCRAGIEGAKGGMFKSPRGAAVDPDTGDLYVTDRDNFRVQRFSFDDNGTPGDPADDLPVFEGAWGSNTVPLGASGDDPGPNERQVVNVHFSLSNTDQNVSGSFKLSFDGQVSAAIAWPPTEQSIQDALEDLSNVDPGDVSVTEPITIPINLPTNYDVRWDVEFTGTYANTNVPSIVIDKSGIEADGFVTPSVTAIPEGNSNYELCTVASECQAGLPGQSAGAFASAGPAAIDVSKDGATATGMVIVADPGNRRIQELSIHGAFNRAFAIGVDSGAAEFEICTIASTCQAGIQSESNGGFGNGAPSDVAVDADGIVYANVTNSSGRLTRFGSTVAGDDDAAAAGLLLAEPLTDPLRGGLLGGLEADPVTDNLLVLSDGSTETVVQEIDTDAQPPVEVDVHMEASPSNQPVNGLGVLNSPAGDKLFVSSSGGVIEHRVLVLTDEGAGPFEMAIAPVSELGSHGVTFNGTLDANGPTVFAVSHNFQYSADGGDTWVTVPSTEGPFSDDESHAVDDTVTGLEANTAYLVRLTGSRAFNGGLNQVSAPLAFQTLAVPPTVETRQSTLRTDTTATLVGSLNPEGSPTEWHFEWGTDATYGNTTPLTVATGGKSRLVKANIEGLSADTTYHYRLVADNGQEASPGETAVVGDDATFTTRQAVSPDPSLCPNEAVRAGLSDDLSACRAFEMVTPPFKLASLAGKSGSPNLALPSLDGDSLAWRTAVFPISQDVRAPGNGDSYVSERRANGWVAPSLNTVPIRTPFVPAGMSFVSGGSSGDLQTLSWELFGGDSGGAELLPNDGAYNNRLYTRRTGTGVNGFSGWITNTDTQICAFFDCAEGNESDAIIIHAERDDALFNDDGSAMARWGAYRELGETPGTAANEDPSGEQQLAGAAGGRTLYLQRVEDPDDLPTSPKIVAAACTGSGAGATRVPNRQFAGPSTAIGVRECAAGGLTSRRGAVAGAGRTVISATGEGIRGPAATALSNDGNRLFFESPDRSAEGIPKGGCTTETGVDTNCVPQLYVRQYDNQGNATVRWVSRSRSVADGEGGYGGAMIAGQRIDQLGAGVGFEGASRNGDVVYFKTNAPLVPSDPNGGESITAGSASGASWDLYRYELPADRGQDPGDGTLTRISGGPSGTADPATDSPDGDGGVLRFHSDDGSRAYFVTTAPIAGTDSAPPRGGATTPGGVAGNGSTRNLYLFDENAGGADRYRFVARIGFAKGFGIANPLGALAACASYDQLMAFSEMALKDIGKCFRGTPDGEHVIFPSAEQLTSDDDDGAVDIFLYDAGEDELTRITAPPLGTGGYVCGIRQCNGELNQGFSGVLGGVSYLVGPFDGARGWRGAAYLSLAEDESGVLSVFFESRLPFVPEDTNGNHADVYEWREGEVSLISPGNSANDAHFSGNSLDGEDVFFSTAQRIDPRELSEQDHDFYDARRGGGFAFTPPPRPCDVLAFECEIAASPAPAIPLPATPRFAGQGNVKPAKGKPRRCRKGKLRRGKRCLGKAGIARKRCRKQRGRAKRRCVRKQVRSLTRAQKKSQRRQANPDRRSAR